MAYITTSNMLSIIFNSNTLEIDDTSKEVYKKPVYIFNRYEKKSLLAIQELLEDPDHWFDTIYIPRKTVDSYNYVYSEKKPSYHNTPECERLKSDYINFEIPPDIKAQGKDKINEFREWFKTVEYLLDKDPEIFAVRLHSRWGILTNPKGIKRENSGYMKIENLDLGNIESQIDNLLKEAGRYYYQSPKNTEILKRYGRDAYKASKDDFENDLNNYSNDEVKEFLSKYNKTYKQPLRDKLIHYYRIKLNPNLKMEGIMLDQLGFKQCGACVDHDYTEPKHSKHQQHSEDTFSTSTNDNYELSNISFDTNQFDPDLFEHINDPSPDRKQSDLRTDNDDDLPF